MNRSHDEWMRIFADMNTAEEAAKFILADLNTTRSGAQHDMQDVASLANALRAWGLSQVQVR